MSTRTVTGTLRHPGGDTAWQATTVTFKYTTRFASGSTVVYPSEVVTATTDSLGAFTATLATPDNGAGSVPVFCTLPDGSSFYFNLAYGLTTLTLADLVSTATALGDGSWLSIQSLIATHAALKATTSVLGHVQVDGSTITASNGVISSVGGSPTGSAGGVLGGTYPNPSFAADMATQAELDSEASTRASADSTHAALTTSAHGGIVASGDSRLTNARTPTAHASTHAAASSDPLTLTESQITGLVADLAAKLAAASNLSDLASAATARTNLGVFQPVTTDFTANGSYSIPTGATFIRLLAQGGGGGGGSGARQPAGTVAGGGGGGAGGCLGDVTYTIAEIGGAGTGLTIAVAAAVAGGPAATTNASSGTIGTNGNATLMTRTSDSQLLCIGTSGSAGGAGSTAPGGAGGSINFGTFPGGAGGTTSTSATAASGTSANAAAGGGGAGGGIDAANVARAGGSGSYGGRSTIISQSAPPTLPAGGAATGVAGGAGLALPSGLTLPGSGGAGGGANTGGAGGAGGNGATYGAGGGGGGASRDGANSGAGGTGAQGFARIIVW